MGYFRCLDIWNDSGVQALHTKVKESGEEIERLQSAVQEKQPSVAVPGPDLVNGESDAAVMAELERLRQESKSWERERLELLAASQSSKQLSGGAAGLGADISGARTPENMSMCSKMTLEEDEEVESSWRQRLSEFEKQMEDLNRELASKNQALTAQQLLVKELKQKKRSHRRLVKELRAKQEELQRQVEERQGGRTGGGAEGSRDGDEATIQAAEIIREKEEALKAMVEKLAGLERSLQESQSKSSSSDEEKEALQVGWHGNCFA